MPIPCEITCHKQKSYYMYCCAISLPQAIGLQDDCNCSLWEKAKGMHVALLGMDDKPAESLWVRIREQTTVANVVLGISNRPSAQEEEVDKAFWQLEEASRSQDPGPHGGLQDPERKEQGKKQDRNLGLQETRLWPVQWCVWNSSMRGRSRREDESSKAGWFSWVTSSKFKNDPSPCAGSKIK